MSSPKRSHAGDDSEYRPSKQQKLQTEALGFTGLEECGILHEMPGKVPASEVTPSEGERYNRRAKVASYAKSIRKRRAMANRIRADWKGMPSSAQKGLKNVTGVLCYRHSLFQALIHSPKFNNWLLNFHQLEDCVEDNQEDCVPCKLRDLVQAYWTGGPPDVEVAVKKVNQVFKTNNWAASGGDPNGQGDPEDQYTWITNILSAKLPRSIYNLFEAASCLVTDNCVKCDTCGNISKTFNHLTGPLSVPLSPKISGGDLSMYLEKYMEEIVTDYKCEKCGEKKKDKKRYQEIVHSPDVLLVQLKRWNWSGKKDSSQIPFSADLNLNRYRAGANKDNSNYELSAVVLHNGTKASGHYICLAKGEDGTWLRYNDHHKQNISLETVLDPGNGKGFTPYLLFFQRKSK